MRSTSVCISQGQKRFHVATETASVFLMAPALAWIATRPTLPPLGRLLAGTMVVAILVVDGGLLLRWKELDRSSSY